MSNKSQGRKRGCATAAFAHIEADRVISNFLFDPNLEPCPQNIHRGEAIGPPEPISGMARASVRRWVKEQWNAT